MSSTIQRIIGAITPPILLQGYHKLRQARAPRRDIYTLSTGEAYYSGKGVGGKWEEIGQLQYDFLVSQGLQPHHTLLDIGCGSLRGGVHFVRYLDDGHYYGMDRAGWLLRAAVEVELPRYGLSDKTVHLVERDDFNFSVFGTTFDFALAQSVFTHLTWNAILRCLVNVEKVLSEQGRFFATFLENPYGSQHLDPIIHASGEVVSCMDADPFHYPFDVFVELAARTSLEVQYLGAWGHPRNQQMMVFTRKS